MKKLYKYSILLMAAFLFAPFAAHADEVEGIKLEKTVDNNGDGTYTINLGTFVTGTTVTTITQTTRPTDIVLVLDVSGSMSQNITSTSKGSQVNSNSQLNWQTTYIITIGGVDYYLREGQTTSDYRYYYSSDSEPGPSNGTLCYQGNREPYVSEIINNVEGATGIYQITTTTQTRLEAMKTAAKAFVQTVFEKNPTEGDKHQIAIVKFAGGSGNNFDMTNDTYTGGWNSQFEYNGTRTVYALTPVTSGTQCDATINAFQAGGATNAGKGLETAEDILSATNVANNGHLKVVVFFTDGEPGLSGFDPSTARRAVNAAHTIKGLTTTVTDENGNEKTINGKVYSVALLASGGSGDRVGRFMHYVSSNYDFEFPSSSDYNFNSNYTGAGGGGEAPHDHYFLTGGGDLSSIFESIANSSAEGSSDYSLKETSLVTVDVVSNYFKLPDGVDASNTSAIKVLFAPMTGIKDQSQWNNETYMKNLDNYVFGTPVTAAEAVANTTNPLVLVEGEGDAQYPSVVIGKDSTQTPPGDKITVTNYNFADNYCGANKSSTGSFINWRGYKLVIQIPIEVDVNNPGGTSLETNAEGSGLFIQNEQGEYVPLVEFPRPTVNLPNIIIRKYGLLYEGEGASFKLEKLNDEGTAVDTSVDPYYIVISASDNDPNTFDYVQVKLNEPGRYRVTETDWGWNYTRTADTSALEEDDSKDTERTLVATASGTNTNSQPYIDRDVSGDTEQTITLPGGNEMTGAVYDFRNAIKYTERRNYSEAHVTNIFPTQTQKTTVSE